MNAIDDAKRRVKNLLKERERLKDELASAEATAKRVRERLREIDGGPFGGYGDLGHAKIALADAERVERDKTLPRVVWAEGFEPQDGDWVLEKVTPKRIYVRKAGKTATELFSRDGSHISSWQRWKIDVEKTFPEGLQ